MTLSPATSVTLAEPTRCEVGGQAYEFRGFLVLSQFDVAPPAAQLLCGTEVVAVALEEVALPAWVAEAEERIRAPRQRCKRLHPR